MLTIDPPPAATMRRANIWHDWNTALRLIARMRSQSASVASRKRVPTLTPGRVHEDIGPPVCQQGFRQQLFERLPRGYVDGAISNFSTERFQSLDAGFAAVFRQIGDDDVDRRLNQSSTLAAESLPPITTAVWRGEAEETLKYSDTLTPPSKVLVAGNGPSWGEETANSPQGTQRTQR